MSNIITRLKSGKFYQYLRTLERNARKNVKRFLLTRKLDKATPIFVFQMGKVASSSVYHSLKKQYPGAVGFGHAISDYHWKAALMHDTAHSGKPLKIISPVREPIERNISEFFELFENYTGKKYKKSGFTTEQLIELYFKNYPHDFTLNWFDENIKKYFGIDIYETPFPASRIATYHRGNVSLLVFRIDISDAEKEKAIRDFVELPSFRLNNTNIGNKKPYSDAYRDFKKAFSAPEDYLDMFRQSKYFNYFYSKDEIEKNLARWMK